VARHWAVLRSSIAWHCKCLSLGISKVTVCCLQYRNSAVFVTAAFSASDKTKLAKFGIFPNEESGRSIHLPLCSLSACENNHEAVSGCSFDISSTLRDNA